MKLAGRYEIQRELGRGGMATVHLAHDTALDRNVAIKMIRLDGVKSEIAGTFLPARRAWSPSSNHPAIVPVYDFQRDGELMFYVMPVVEGVTLRTMLDGGPLSALAVVGIGLQLTSALAYSHLRGVVHRDIKPENIMIEGDDNGQARVLLTDYGLAVIAYEQRITDAGTIIGTPAYLSPEQVREGHVDARTDIYMLGAVLYECLTGAPPFDDTGSSRLYRILSDTPLAPSSGEPALDALVMQCLEKRMGDRPQMACDVGERLQEILGDRETNGSIVARAEPSMPDAPYAQTSLNVDSQLLVGREAEVSVVSKSLSHVLRERTAQLLFISGERGSGKSRMLDELVRLAAVQGVPCLRTSFEEDSLPLLAFAELLYKYLERRTDGGVSESGDGVPTIDRTLDPLQFGRALAAVVAQAPLVLALDDAHKAPGALHAMEQMFAELDDTPALIVCTSEPRRVPRALARHSRFREVSLAPLSPSDHRTLIRDLLLIDALPGLPDVDDALAESMYQHTLGNPGRTNELVTLFCADGRLTQNGDRWQLVVEEAPGSEHDKIGDKLLVEGEYEAAKDAFEAAHTERRLSGRTDIQDECNYLLRLANLAHKLGRYDDAIQHCDQGLELLNDQSPLTAARLMAAAGLACTSAGRFDDAADWIGRALDRLEEVEHRTGERTRVEASLYRTQGNMHVGRGRPVKAIAAYEKSLELVDPRVDAWEHSIALFNVGEACTLAGDYERAMRFLGEAFAAKSRINDRWGLSYTHAMRSRIHFDFGELEAASVEATAGLELGQAIHDPKLCSIHRTLLGRIHLALGQVDKAQPLLRQALSDGISCDAIPEVIDAHLQLADLHVLRDQLQQAADAARAALDLAAASGSTSARGRALLSLGRIEESSTRFASAERRYRRASEILAREGNPYRMLEVRVAEASLAKSRGQLAEARDLLTDVVGQAGTLGAELARTVATRILTTLG